MTQQAAKVLFLVPCLFFSPSLHAEDRLDLTKNLDQYPAVLRQDIGSLNRYVDGLPFPLAVKNELKEAGVEHMLENQSKLEDGLIPGFDPVISISAMLRRYTRDSAHVRSVDPSLLDLQVRQPSDSDLDETYYFVGRQSMPLRMRKDEYQLYREKLDALETSHPSQLGTVLANSARKHSEREEILAPFRDDYPKSSAAADAILRQYDAKLIAGNHQAANTLSKRANDYLSKWGTSTLVAIGAVVLAWRWGSGGARAEATPPKPAPVQPTTSMNKVKGANSEDATESAPVFAYDYARARR